MDRFRKWLREWWCQFWHRGHDRCLEDLGGCVVECCTRCTWTGRQKEYPMEFKSYDPS